MDGVVNGCTNNTSNGNNGAMGNNAANSSNNNGSSARNQHHRSNSQSHQVHHHLSNVSTSSSPTGFMHTDTNSSFANNGPMSPNSQDDFPPGYDMASHLKRKELFTQRKQREFIPDNKKDDSYWDRRRRNNEAAKRSREKRRYNDMVLEQRVVELTKENHVLKAQLDAIKDKYNICGENLVSVEQIMATLPTTEQVLSITKRAKFSNGSSPDLQDMVSDSEGKANHGWSSNSKMSRPIYPQTPSPPPMQQSVIQQSASATIDSSSQPPQQSVVTPCASIVPPNVTDASMMRKCNLTMKKKSNYSHSIMNEATNDDAQMQNVSVAAAAAAVAASQMQLPSSANNALQKLPMDPEKVYGNIAAAQHQAMDAEKVLAAAAFAQHLNGGYLDATSQRPNYVSEAHNIFSFNVVVKIKPLF